MGGDSCDARLDPSPHLTLLRQYEKEQLGKGKACSSWLTCEGHRRLVKVNLLEKFPFLQFLKFASEELL